jgi:hypothetical protein
MFWLPAGQTGSVDESCQSVTPAAGAAAAGAGASGPASVSERGNIARTLKPSGPLTRAPPAHSADELPAGGRLGPQHSSGVGICA